jgi:hypothetical protein
VPEDGGYVVIDKEVVEGKAKAKLQNRDGFALEDTGRCML